MQPAENSVSSAAEVRVRTLDTLPKTELDWLRLRDHFVATVGPSAGTGVPFGPLLVLADATFAPHSRFPNHSHREMEILSIVVRGTLSHHGDQANGATLKAREAQLISARGGMVHAEGNDTDADIHMLQIWFTPNEHGGEAAYFQRTLHQPSDGGRQLIAGDPAMPLRASAKVWWLDLVAGREEALTRSAKDAGYLLAMDGPLELSGGAKLKPSEGAIICGAGATVKVDVGTSAALWVEVPGLGC